MRISTITFGALLLAATTAPALAQDTAPPKPFTLTGNVTLTSDYRFRGLTQSDGDGAIQGTLNLNHSSGLYVGTFVSTIDGDGSTPALPSNAEIASATTTRTRSSTRTCATSSRPSRTIARALN